MIEINFYPFLYLFRIFLKLESFLYFLFNDSSLLFYFSKFHWKILDSLKNVAPLITFLNSYRVFFPSYINNSRDR